MHGAAAAAPIEAGAARPLCGGPIAFSMCAVHLRDGDRLEIATSPLGELADWAAGEGAEIADRVAACLDALSSPRPPFAGLPMDRPCIFGIINVTPDSFSDGGRFADSVATIAHGRALIEAGADCLDIGGESTRPGASPVDAEVELDRVLPVIEGLADAGIPLSIDTRHAAVMRAALDAGARIVNDVSALTDDPAALDVVKQRAAPVILMHKKGDPSTMHHDPRYAHVTHEVYAYLKARIQACVEIGIPLSDIAVDPGFGFGKTAAHNRQILAEIALLHGLGCPVMIGASRKFAAGDAGADRLGASLSAACWAAAQGVQLFRVHDVAETRQALGLVARLLGPPAGR